MDTIVVKLLEIKTTLLNMYHNIKCKITNTTTFIIDQKNEIYRYYLIQILTNIKSLLQQVINLLDVRGELIECSKITNNKNITMIIDARNHNNSMVNIIEHLNNLNTEYNPVLNPNILLKCHLINSDNSRTCLKDCILKYNDSDKLFDNTLDNILKLNGIKTDSDAKLDIIVFKNTKLQPINIEYSKYKDYHLNDFIDSLYE